LLLVPPRRADHPGRKRLDDRKVLCGILFVLYTGIRWEFLPQELGFGSGMTCWRRPGSLTSGSKDDAEAPNATGRVGAVSRAGQG
jgi:transposase